MWTPTAPVRSAFSRMGSSSSPCPRSAQKATTTFFGSDIVERAAQEVEDHGLLRVQPIFGLVERDAVRAVEHAVGDLLATVRGQAVHDEHRPSSEPDERLVDLVA